MMNQVFLYYDTNVLSAIRLQSNAILKVLAVVILVYPMSKRLLGVSVTDFV